MTQQGVSESSSAKLGVSSAGCAGRSGAAEPRGGAARVDRLHGLALGDRDIARDGDGGGDDDDGMTKRAGSRPPRGARRRLRRRRHLGASRPCTPVQRSRRSRPRSRPGEYADVRSALLSALPRARTYGLPRLMRRAHGHVVVGTVVIAAPLTQLLLEALQHSCATTIPRRVFAATDGSAARVECAAAERARAVARAVCVDDDALKATQLAGSARPPWTQLAGSAPGGGS